MITVAIVDDDELACTYLRRMLGSSSSGVQVVGHAHDLDEARRLIDRTTPDVILLDLRLGREHGLELLGAGRESEPPRVLVLTGFPDDGSVLRALSLGACGFVTKSIAPAHLLSAIRLVATGHRVLGPGLPSGGVQTGQEEERDRIAALLTVRELEVLRRLGAGLSNGDIAAALTLSEGTVKGHVSSLMLKLGCESRLQAGLLAQRLTI